VNPARRLAIRQGSSWVRLVLEGLLGALVDPLALPRRKGMQKRDLIAGGYETGKNTVLAMGCPLDPLQDQESQLILKRG